MFTDARRTIHRSLGLNDAEAEEEMFGFARLAEQRERERGSRSANGLFTHIQGALREGDHAGSGAARKRRVSCTMVPGTHGSIIWIVHVPSMSESRRC